MKEASVQNEIRLSAADDGLLLLRQNSGALKDQYDRLVRFGLANESRAMNDQYKSGDLVGIRPTLIGPEHVGQTLGVFVSIECKRSDWRGVRSEHEAAQERWNSLVRSYGGLAGFASSVEAARQIWGK
jgi:hypothetical protein